MTKKLINIRNAAAALLLFAASTGCDKIKDFGNTNVNPAATTTPIVGALLTNAESGMGGFAANTLGGLYCQYFSETQYTDASLYSSNQANFAGTYSGTLYDLQNIILQNPGNNMTAVSRILKAYIFSTITDRWNDIPYSQALQGFVPGYDKQLDIYKSLLKELKESVAQFDGASSISGDIIFSGDAAKWKKTANSLRMILALRLSKKYPGAADYAATEFKDAYGNANGHITSNADNFSLVYPGGTFKNPWFATYDGRKDYAESKTFTDLTSGLGDSRAASFGGNAAAASSTQGFPYGLLRADAVNFEGANSNSWARILKASFRQETSPIAIISAAQVALAKAEAAERGWLAPLTTTDAEAFYKAGIDLSFEQWGAGSASGYYGVGAAANYTTGAGVAVIGTNPYNSIPATSSATTATKLDRIALQRYIATYPDGTQGWAEWRRTGVPNVKPTAFATNASKQIPVRMIYGQSEYSLNPAGVAQGAATLTGGDVMDAKVWWHQ